MQNMVKLEEGGLQQQNTISGSPCVSQELESGATVRMLTKNGQLKKKSAMIFFPQFLASNF